ncbi:MAG: hypothetical protein ACR2N3_08750 [Pyrinomonadaceae bacterium]
MKGKVENRKTEFRNYQRNLPVEKKIEQLYLMQTRYLQISKNAIEQGLKKKTAEFERACRLSGKEII